jgi:hypothetical protein
MVGALPTKNKIEKPHPHRVWLFYVLVPRRESGRRRGTIYVENKTDFSR